jgi:hypothetical protein
VHLTSWFRRLLQNNSFISSVPRLRSPGGAVRLSVSPELFEERALLSAAPVVALMPSGPLNYTEGSGPIVIAGSSSVTDADSLNFDGGTLTESVVTNATSQDRLAIQDQGTAAGQIGVSGSNVTFGGTIIGTFTGGTGTTPLVIDLNQDATPVAVTALQENITFEVVGVPSSTSPRTFQTILTDGAAGNASLPATETINVLQANPVITVSKPSLTVSNSSPVVIDPGISVTSPPALTLNGAVLSVHLSAGTSADQLGFLNHGRSKGKISISGTTLQLNGTAIGTFSGGVGTNPLTITFNANAALADVQTVARSITFRSIGHSAHQTGVEFQFSDGEGGISNTSSATITVTHGGKPSGPHGHPGPHGHSGK